MDAIGKGTRAIALVGPAGAGKTSLAEALLHAAGAIHRLGSVEAGTSQGDSSAEARARGGSTELNLMRFDWGRSEEHTSELQSRENLVCRLLPEKTKRPS